MCRYVSSLHFSSTRLNPTLHIQLQFNIQNNNSKLRILWSYSNLSVLTNFRTKNKPLSFWLRSSSIINPIKRVICILRGLSNLCIDGKSNKTKYFRLRLSDEVNTKRPETDLRLPWDCPEFILKSSWRIWCQKMKNKSSRQTRTRRTDERTDGRTNIVTPWAPDGAKNMSRAAAREWSLEKWQARPENLRELEKVCRDYCVSEM